MAKDNEQGFRWLRISISILSISLIGFLVFRERQEILDSIRSVSFSFFLFLLGLTLASRIFVALRWFFLLRGERVGITLIQSLQITFVGLFASNFLPTTIGGDIVRLTAAARITKQTVPCAASLLMDRLVGILGMILVSPLGLIKLVSSGAILQGAGRGIPGSLSLASSGYLPRIQSAFRKLASEVMQVFNNWRRDPLHFALSVSATLGHMVILFLTLTLFLERIGSALDYLTVAGLWSLSYFITLIPISINGLGVQELSITMLFNQIGGIPFSDAVMMAVIIRVLQILASTPGGVLLAFLFPDLLHDVRGGKV